jgi:hypothetical protein
MINTYSNYFLKNIKLNIYKNKNKNLSINKMNEIYHLI